MESLQVWQVAQETRLQNDPTKASNSSVVYSSQADNREMGGIHFPGCAQATAEQVETSGALLIG